MPTTPLLSATGSGEAAHLSNTKPKLPLPCSFPKARAKARWSLSNQSLAIRANTPSGAYSERKQISYNYLVKLNSCNRCTPNSKRPRLSLARRARTTKIGPQSRRATPLALNSNTYPEMWGPPPAASLNADPTATTSFSDKATLEPKLPTVFKTQSRQPRPPPTVTEEPHLSRTTNTCPP